MKKIIIIIGCAISSFCSMAQQVELEETPPNWLVMLSNLNQSQIEGGFLYNKSAMFANLYNFNKSTTFNTANYPYFKQALLEKHKANNIAVNKYFDSS